MSRLAKKSIEIPQGVTIAQEEDAIVVVGPKGEKRLRLAPGIRIDILGKTVSVAQEAARERRRTANAGTMWALIRNTVAGVLEGFTKVLEIEGIGYRAAMEGNTLVLSLGYAAPVRFPIPDEVHVRVEKSVITISGADKELVGRVAANIRALKRPEPYKGKGIRYQGEVLRRKVGKKAAAATGAA